MKRLFIIRHAKSDQSFFGNDFERPLNDRGKTDAPLMAKRLADRKIKIDALVSSPAKRAEKTAELFAECLGKNPKDIIFISALYHASPDVFYEVISALPDELDSIALFSHNPGITYFVNSLDAKTKVDNMPTTAIFAVAADIAKWIEFTGGRKEFLFFDYPKNI